MKAKACATATKTISTLMMSDCAIFEVSRSKRFIFSSTVKAQACQKLKKRIALMQRNFAKGEKGYRRSSVAI